MNTVCVLAGAIYYASALRFLCFYAMFGAVTIVGLRNGLGKHEAGLTAEQIASTRSVQPAYSIREDLYRRSIPSIDRETDTTISYLHGHILIGPSWNCIYFPLHIPMPPGIVFPG
jgi:hypothetical protein